MYSLYSFFILLRNRNNYSPKETSALWKYSSWHQLMILCVFLLSHMLVFITYIWKQSQRKGSRNWKERERQKKRERKGESMSLHKKIWSLNFHCTLFQFYISSTSSIFKILSLLLFIKWQIGLMFLDLQPWFWHLKLSQFSTLIKLP